MRSLALGLFGLAFAGFGADREVSDLRRAIDRQDSAELRRLSELPAPVGPVAAFASANATVREGARAGVNHRLREAISTYRELLDAGPPAPLVEADLRHNLEIAKRLLRWDSPESKQGRPRRSPTSSADAAETGDVETRNGEPDETRESASSAEGPKSSSDRGPVTRPNPGIGLGDPGPLDPEDAARRLETALTRIRRDRRPSPRSSLPRSPDDY